MGKPFLSSGEGDAMPLSASFRESSDRGISFSLRNNGAPSNHNAIKRVFGLGLDKQPILLYYTIRLINYMVKHEHTR